MNQSPNSEFLGLSLLTRVWFSLDSEPQAQSINNVHTHTQPWLAGNQSITLTCGPRTPDAGQDRDRYCNIMNTPVTHWAKKGNPTKNDTFIIIHDSTFCMIYFYKIYYTIFCQNILNNCAFQGSLKKRQIKVKFSEKLKTFSCLF